MEILDNRALLFKTRNPDKYTLIPKSKALPRDDGGFDVAVHWGLDECRVLKNLGVKNVPSPIYGRYNWPGRYTPMQHQKATASFLTLHRRAFVFSEPGCVDADTEYLSPTGWKRIADYAGGEVAQYDPATKSATFVQPTEFVKLPCDEMVRIKTKYGLDQLLSPEHRTLIHSNAADKWCVMEAAEVLAAHDDWHAGRVRHNPRKVGSSTVCFSHMAIPTTFAVRGGGGVQLSDEALRVQVAVIADGHFPNEGLRCVVRLKKQRKVARMHALLKASGIDYFAREQNTPTAQGYTVFTFLAPTHDKEFGVAYWGCSTMQLALIAEESVHWDGTERGGEKGPSFSTTSKASADFIQYAWVSVGRTARILEDRREGKYRGGVCYTVQTRGGGRGLLALKSRGHATVTRAPSTDGFKYCFMVPSTFLVFRRNGCIFASGNTGKTLSAAWAADYLMNLKLVRRVLIICPVSIMHSAWVQDMSNSIIHRSVVVAHHAQASRRVELIQENHEIVVINYEGVALVAKEIINDGRFDLIVIDEANSYKTVTTKRWKALASLLKPDTYLWMMTGTPSSQSPMDAYGLARLVNPNGVPKFLTAWRDQTMNKITMFKWAPKIDAPDKIHKALQPAIRYTKAECLDLPPVITQTREVPLSPQQAKYYNALKTQLLIQTAGQTVTAINAAAALNKLLQISAGIVYTDNKEVVEFDATPRLSVLLEALEQTERKVLVFALFRASIESIAQFLAKHGIAAEQIHGGVPANKRQFIIDRFQHRPDPRVLVLQPQAAAHGITLTAADTVIFYGPLMSVEQYVQAIARSDRKGQDSDKVTVIHIEGSPVEKRMFKALAGKVNDQTLVVDMFTAELRAKVLPRTAHVV